MSITNPQKTFEYSYGYVMLPPISHFYRYVKEAVLQCAQNVGEMFLDVWKTDMNVIRETVRVAKEEMEKNPDRYDKCYSENYKGSPPIGQTVISNFLRVYVPARAATSQGLALLSVLVWIRLNGYSAMVRAKKESLQPPHTPLGEGWVCWIQRLFSNCAQFF